VQHATGNTPAVADRITEELMVSPMPMGVRALARQTGLNPGTVHRALARLTADGEVTRTDEGFTLTTTPEEGQS
jgi:DNA-binding IclR family transcriptional regulator